MKAMVLIAVLHYPGPLMKPAGDDAASIRPPQAVVIVQFDRSPIGPGRTEAEARTTPTSGDAPEVIADGHCTIGVTETSDDPPPHAPQAPTPNAHAEGTQNHVDELADGPRVIRATGFGRPPPRLAPAQGRLMARRAAEANALRNLAAAMGTGFPTTLRGYRIVSTTFRADGWVEVVVEMPAVAAHP